MSATVPSDEPCCGCAAAAVVLAAAKTRVARRRMELTFRTFAYQLDVMSSGGLERCEVGQEVHSLELKMFVHRALARTIRHRETGIAALLRFTVAGFDVDTRTR